MPDWEIFIYSNYGIFMNLNVIVNTMSAWELHFGFHLQQIKSIRFLSEYGKASSYEDENG